MTASKRDLKETAVRYMGGCCVLCSYNKCDAALHFHHMNPHEKDFNISSKSNWYDIRKELNKCVLVCANCHAEIHANLVDLETLVFLQEEARG